MSNPSEPKEESFLGETLFHFLGNGDDERLLDVFDSIVRRGLLLTVGNKACLSGCYPHPLNVGCAHSPE